MQKLSLLALSFLVSGCGAEPRKAREIAIDEAADEEVVEETSVAANKAGSNLFVLESEAQLNDAIASGKLVLVDFFAEWCGPCKRFLETLAKVAPEFPNVIFIKVNVDDFKELASKYQVSSIPSIKIFGNGNTQPLEKFTGAKSPADLRKLLKELGA